MTTKNRVSAIMPFLNTEQYIEEAIESVRTQTYENWELLLVDDGSSDGSSEIAMERAARHRGQIVYLSHSGAGTRGISASRNLGIAHATGDYIAFLDADDVWVPRKLEQQLELVSSRSEAAMVYGLSQWWYSWSGKLEDAERDYVHALGVPADVPIEPPTLLRPFFVLQEAAIPNPSSILVRRSTAQLVGGFEEAFVGLYEDQAFYAKVCAHAPVIPSDKCWDRYRQHPTAITATVASRNDEARARCVFLTWLIGYLSAHGVNGEICAALRHQRFRCAHPRLDRIAGRVARGA
jgi:glycosyltransferase involved in cell wall biosynthesis